MEKYEELNIEIVTFESDDIIVTSIPGDIPTDTVTGSSLVYGEEEW